VVSVRQQPDDRLNVLLTTDEQSLADHLPRLLAPQGVRAIWAPTLDQAVSALERSMIHVAVIDMAMPVDPATGAGAAGPVRPLRLPGGMKLLQVIRRLDRRPPAVVVVRGRHFDQRTDDFLLAEALKLDVFSVLDKPVGLEQMLQVLQRALQRYFGGNWPSPRPS
jgi:CheY-like chemotaxis protein